MKAVKVAEGKFKLVIDSNIDGRRVRKTKMLPGEVTSESDALKIGRAIFSSPCAILMESLGGIAGLPCDSGAVYFAKNAGLPGVVKIGMTRRSVWDRMRNLSTVQPEPWTLLGHSYVKHAKAVESILHRHFTKQRVVSNREFFTVTDDVARQALSACDAADGVSLTEAIKMVR